MARTRRTVPVTHTRHHNVWLKNWGHSPKNCTIPSSTYMRKVLKYYPKNPQVLKQITLALPPSQCFAAIATDYQDVSLSKKVFRKYKREYIKHVIIDRSVQAHILLHKFPGFIQTLKFTVPGYYYEPFDIMPPDILLKKLVMQNKRLKAVEISLPPSHNAKQLIKKLKYTQSLQSVLIEGHASFSHKDYTRMFRSNQCHLQNVTVTSLLLSEYDLNKENVIELFDRIASLPKLKTFQFDAKLPAKFNVDDIRFKKFAERKAKYDIRICHSENELTFSEKNASSLENLDLLAISTKESWPRPEPVYDRTQEEFLQAQEKAKQSLFLNVFTMEMVDLYQLFQVCKNISVLDLTLSESKSYKYDAFFPLQDLCNLREIYLNLHGSVSSFESVFENLTLCAQKHQKINLVALRLFKDDTLEECKDMMLFLEQCSKSVTKVLLHFYQVTSPVRVIDKFYEGIKKLRALKSLMVLIERAAAQSEATLAFNAHTKNLSEILKSQDTLEEFYFFAPYMTEIQTTGIQFHEAKNLKKIATDCCRHGISKQDFENILRLPNLTYLEADLPMMYSDDEWRYYVRKIENLDKLEILLFKVMNPIHISARHRIMRNLTPLIRIHKSLKLVILTEEALSVLNIIGKNYCWADFDKLYWKLLSRYSAIRPDKIRFK